MHDSSGNKITLVARKCLSTKMNLLFVVGEVIHSKKALLTFIATLVFKLLVSFPVTPGWTLVVTKPTRKFRSNICQWQQGRKKCN